METNSLVIDMESTQENDIGNLYTYTAKESSSNKDENNDTRNGDVAIMKLEEVLPVPDDILAFQEIYFSVSLYRFLVVLIFNIYIYLHICYILQGCACVAD